MNSIKILSPRYHDRTILIGCWHVKRGINRIDVAQGNYAPLYMDGKEIASYPVETKRTANGREFKVYVVPIDDFETVHGLVREREFEHGD